MVDDIPAGPGWLHELKYDGYRILSRINKKKVELYTRHGNDWTRTFSDIAHALKKISVESAWIDGEVVVIRPDGTTSFQDLQNVLTLGEEKRLSYFVFDIMYLDGYDLRGARLIDRKGLLRQALEPLARGGQILFSDHISGSGRAVFDNACRLSLEGIISKAADSHYTSTRGKSWLKIRCQKRQEFVIGGYTRPGGSRKGFGALLLGVYGPDGKLHYKGRVGTGFTERILGELAARLRNIRTDTNPFADHPKEMMRGVRWVRPELVAEVQYGSITNEGYLRHSSFQGLREDKPPSEVVMEEPKPVSEETGNAGRDTAYGNRATPEIKMTNPERVLYPETGLTKSDLAEYYSRVYELMLPHLEGRPLTIVRCPHGWDKGCFYQKHDNPTVPRQLPKVPIIEDGKTVEYLMANSLRDIMYLVQMDVLEIHTWCSKSDKLEYPDKFVMDIDPDPAVEWEGVVEAAMLLRGLLEDLGLVSFLKTTGGKGLHVVAPLSRRQNWDEVKEFTRAVAEGMVKMLPNCYTAKLSKSKRKGKIFIDYMRNMRGATAIEAYSTRARSGAPVAVPIGWDEPAKGVRSDAFNIRNIPERLSLGKDPWDGFFSVKQSITAKMKKKLGLNIP